MCWALQHAPEQRGLLVIDVTDSYMGMSVLNVIDAGCSANHQPIYRSLGFGWAVRPRRDSCAHSSSRGDECGFFKLFSALGDTGDNNVSVDNRIWRCCYARFFHTRLEIQLMIRPSRSPVSFLSLGQSRQHLECVLPLSEYQSLRWLFQLALLVFGLILAACGDSIEQPPIEVPASIPTGAGWIEHLTKDLLPFYTSAESLGSPVGNFPTWRCNNGSVATKGSNDCEYAKNQQWWIDPAWQAQREFVRTRSRQTFLYGIAYHMTGDARMLYYHIQGIKWLREHGLDRDINGKLVGGAFGYYEPTKPLPAYGPDLSYRSSQDQAYAVLAFSMNYYLTRDPSALRDMIELKDFIYTTYWDQIGNYLKWKLAVSDLDPTRQRDGAKDHDKQYRLVSHLDQINAYLLLPFPFLPDGQDKNRWEADLRRTLDSMLSHFYSSKYNLFWGEYTTSDEQEIGGEHQDFGTTGKAFWMAYLVGRALNNNDWISLGRSGMIQNLDRAYITDETIYPQGAGTKDWGFWDWDRMAHKGSWAGQFTGNDMKLGATDPKEIYPNSQWWIDAELNQHAATLALNEPRWLRYLATTYPKWFELRVDQQNKGVYHSSERCKPNQGGCAADGRQIQWGKGNLWKGGFHESEHALVSYLTSQSLRSEPATLFFALHKNKVNELLLPYLFHGQLDNRKSAPFEDAILADYEKVTATFSSIN